MLRPAFVGMLVTVIQILRGCVGGIVLEGVAKMLTYIRVSLVRLLIIALRANQDGSAKVI